MALICNLFRKDPLPEDAFNPYRQQRQPARKPKPLNRQRSLDLLASAVIK